MKFWHKACIFVFFLGLWQLGNTIALVFMAGLAVGIIFMIAMQIKEDRGSAVRSAVNHLASAVQNLPVKR